LETREKLEKKKKKRNEKTVPVKKEQNRKGDKTAASIPDSGIHCGDKKGSRKGRIRKGRGKDQKGRPKRQYLRRCLTRPTGGDKGPGLSHLFQNQTQTLFIKREGRTITSPTHKRRKEFLGKKTLRRIRKQGPKRCCAKV